MGEDVISLEGRSDDELDDSRARAIILEIFQKAGRRPPYDIEFLRERDADSRPRIRLDEGRLQIVASTENQLRRLVGRFLVRQKWSPITWFLANHGRWFIVINVFLLGALLEMSVIFSQASPSLHSTISMWSLNLTSLVLFVIIYGGPVKHCRLKRELAIKMRHMDCITEYDARDYMFDEIPLAMSFIIPVLWTVASLLIVMNHVDTSSLAFEIEMVVLLGWSLFSIIPMAIASRSASKSDLCHGRRADDAKGGTRYNVSKRLQNVLADMIDRVELRDTLRAKLGNFDGIDVKFRNIKYPNCRLFNFYLSKRTLHIKASDVSEKGAYHLGLAELVLYSLRARSSQRVSQATRVVFNFLFSMSAAIALIVIGYSVSQTAVVIACGIILVIFLTSWYGEWKHNAEVRNELASILRGTDGFSERAVRFYARAVNKFSVRMDLSILMIGLFVIIGITWLMVTAPI